MWPRNPTIRFIRRLQRSARLRKETGRFIVEGVRLLEEALQASWMPETLLHTEGLDARGEAVVAGFRGKGVEPVLVPEDVMQAAADTQTPQGLLAVLPIRLQELPPAPTFLLVLDGVRDPGNLGAVLRTAAAAGVEAVLLAPGSADPFQPKAVRAGMGAHFRLAVQPAEWDEIAAIAARLPVYLADAAAQTDYTTADLTGPLALVIGGEAAGAGPEAAALNSTGLRVPMPGRMESLNAAVAAGILMFEVVRQRENKS
jgi:TrmH family RNA methyltransferase